MALAGMGVAAACAGAGIATAASGGAASTDVIRGCVRKADGVLRVLPARKAGKPAPKCTGREVAISWNKQGRAGPGGLPGTAGAPGAVGSQGSSGTAGLAGAQGPAGSLGPTGSQGPTGAAGLSGLRGPTGAGGSAGAAGPTGADGPTGPIGPQGPGTTVANAFDFSTSSNTRLLASIQGFEFYGVCSSTGVGFYVKNTNPTASSVYQEVAGTAPTLVASAANGGTSTQTAAGSPVHLTFMAPRATNAFVVEVWGSSLGSNQCHVAAVRTSAVAN
jgi:hypothetical protein